MLLSVRGCERNVEEMCHIFILMKEMPLSWGIRIAYWKIHLHVTG